jgi:hypothetical protein
MLHWIELANMTRPQFLTVSFLAVGIMTGSVIITAYFAKKIL